ncbi:hypothetical protein V8E36_001625 [Tilletia maclaganii]
MSSLSSLSLYATSFFLGASLSCLCSPEAVLFCVFGCRAVRGCYQSRHRVQPVSLSSPVSFLRVFVTRVDQK